MEEDSRELATEILIYFLGRPEATETLEGMTGWRIACDSVTRQQAESAVKTLVAQGLLEEVNAGRRGLQFRLNHARRAEAEEVVASVRRP